MLQHPLLLRRAISSC